MASLQLPMWKAHTCHIYMKENLYHPLAHQISMMMPFVTWALHVTLASRCWNLTLVKSWINLRWIRTSCHHPSKSSLDSILAGTNNLSTGCDFHFYPSKTGYPYRPQQDFSPPLSGSLWPSTHSDSVTASSILRVWRNFWVPSHCLEAKGIPGALIC